MLNTRGGARWRWLDYQCILGSVALSKTFVTSFRKLEWTYVIVLFRRVIIWRINKDWTIVKFTSRKDCLRILRVKRQLKGLDPAAVDLPEGTKIFVNESLCPYHQGYRGNQNFCQWEFVPLLSGIWSKCEKLRDKQKIDQYYTINGLTRLRIEESGQAKIITHIQNLLPDIEIDNF